MRSLLDTPAEAEARVSALLEPMDKRDWSTEFTRHRIKELIKDAQLATAERMGEILKEAAERHWVSPAPVPAGDNMNYKRVEF